MLLILHNCLFELLLVRVGVFFLTIMLGKKLQNINYSVMVDFP